MTLADIYKDYTPGSAGFVQAVEKHCGYYLSRAEIERIAKRAKTAEEFDANVNGHGWWLDIVARTAGEPEAPEAA